MSQNVLGKADSELCKVVVNNEAQYSICPAQKSNSLGWRDAGKAGSKEECQAYINEAASGPLRQNSSDEGSLVDRLCKGNHAVEAGLRFERSAKHFKDAIDRNYIHIKFTETRGGTELGFRLDRSRSDFSGVDFEKGKGMVHVEGDLTLNYIKARCVADVDLSTLQGTGRLMKLDDAEMSTA